MVSKFTIKIAVLLALLLGFSAWHVYDKQKAVQRHGEHVARVLKQRHDHALALAAKNAQETSKALQAKADKDKETKDEQIRTLNTKLNSALVELRNRPNRPPNITYYPASIQACTATQLYREDAEFLAREAARAESVLIERDYYYNAYEEVRKKINGTTE